MQNICTSSETIQRLSSYVCYYVANLALRFAQSEFSNLAVQAINI